MKDSSRYRTRENQTKSGNPDNRKNRYNSPTRRVGLDEEVRTNNRQNTIGRE